MESLLQFTVDRTIRETADTVSLRIRPAGDKPFVYRPGQYLSIVRQLYGAEERRAYSFSSCPETDDFLQLTVKRIPNGAFSNWLHESAEGDVFTATKAYGNFLLPDKIPPRLFYLAGGSGITPVFSHLKCLLNRKEKPRILLLYANTSPSTTIFYDELRALQQAHADRFDLFFFFSRENSGDNSRFGHLNPFNLEETLRAWLGPRPDFGRLPGYLCAPMPLMRMAAMTLRVLDVPDRLIHREQFRPDTRLPRRTIDESRTHRIKLLGEQGTLEFEAFHGETILNAALRQGFRLPYTCKSGVCFSCLARCISGEADLAFVNEILREGPGSLINTCIAYAVSDELTLQYE